MMLAVVACSHQVSAQDLSGEVMLPSTPASPTFRTSSIPAGETIPGDLYIAGETISVAGTVLGDLYVAGSQVDLSGTVAGDVIVAGGQLNLGGTIDGSLRGVGGQVFVSSKIAKNMSIVSGALIVDSATQLAGNATAVAGTVRLDAPLPNNATVLAGTLSLLKPIQGSLMYATDTKSSPVDEALVSGSVTRHEFKQPSSQMMSKPDEKATKAFLSILSIIHLASQLVVGLLLIYLVPKFMQKSAHTFSTQTAKSIGIGFVTLIVLPFVAVFLAITLIGLPLGVLTLVGYGVLMYIGQFVAYYAIGQAVSHKLGKKWGASAVFTLGLLTLTLVGFIPLLGWVASMLAHVAGVGALVLTKKEMIVMLREKKIL